MCPAKKILTNDFAGSCKLFIYAEQLCHFLILEAFSGNVRLYPCAIDHELGNGPFARPPNHFIGSTWCFVNIDLLVGDVVLVKPALGHIAVAAPWSGIDG